VPRPIHQAGLSVLDRKTRLLIGFGEKPISWEEGLRLANGLVLRGPVSLTREDIDKAPGLKVVARPGAGVENIDIEYAANHGIAVINTPFANSETVVEHTLGCMLALSKRICEGDRLVRKGGFLRRDEMMGTELFGKTLGIVGCGQIGTELARKCRTALSMKVLGYDPFVPQKTMASNGIRKVKEFNDLLMNSDVISVHVPLTRETRGLIGSEEFKVMKRGCLLLQMSRGGTVEEGALVSALEKGILRGAAVDVFEEEPPPDHHPLFGFENVIVTPHTAGMTEEAFIRMAEQAAEGVIAVLKGRGLNPLQISSTRVRYRPY
jgi:D-3-phosphoglycerate dehydrogenase